MRAARRLRNVRQIEQYDPDIPLPDLRLEIAKGERAGNISDGFGVYYPALAPAMKAETRQAAMAALKAMWIERR